MAILFIFWHGSPQVLKYKGKVYFIPVHVSCGMFSLDNESRVKIAYFTCYLLA